MKKFNSIIESANPPGINQLWIDKKKLRYFTEGKWYLLGGGGGGGSAEPPEISDHDTWIIDGEDTGKPTRGEKGDTGDDGLTPFIGSNNNWWIDTEDTGINAEGTNGIDGATPEIGANGNWFINGVDTTKPSRGVAGINGTNGTDGANGLTPTIGENGNWMIGAVDTGVKAKGEDGLAGKTPVFEIGEVTTGAAGTAAIVEVVINGVDEAGNPKYKINFTIPRGADGSGGGSDRGRILFTAADLHEQYNPEVELSTVTPAVSEFVLNDCVIDSTATVRQVTAVSEDKQTATLSGIIYSFPAGGVTEQRVQEMIDASIGTINTALDNINGEVI